MEEIEEYDELARVIAQMSPEEGEAPIDLTAYWAARRLCRNAESLRRAEIFLVTDMPKLWYEATEPLLELVEDILKKVDGPSKAKLAAMLNKERILVKRNNAQEQAKNLDETMQALKDHNPYTY